MARILVTDGEQRAALAVVRSLGGAGHHLLVAAARPPSIAGASRFCVGEVTVPDPLGSPGEFRTAIVGACRQHDVDILLPITESAIIAASEESGNLEALGVRLPPPGFETFHAVSDKAALMEVAEGLGIAVPPGITIQAGERPEPPPDWFPAVLKPGRSVKGASGAMQKHSVSHVGDSAALRSALAVLPDSAFPLLLQRTIRGPGIGVFLLMWEGRPVLSFGHRRLREKPPTGGVSVLKESVALDPALLRQSIELVNAFDWQGVAMVEYKMDERTGTPYLMEINGRFWGSLQLAVDAGADFPRALVDLMEGRPPEISPPRVGVLNRWFWGDVDHLLAVSRGRGPEQEGSRIRQALGALGGLFWASRPTVHGDVLKLSDLRPFLVESRGWFRGGRP
jgi:predicted ATP-grasp superfamily ATP-dependent carboligase